MHLVQKVFIVSAAASFAGADSRCSSFILNSTLSQPSPSHH